MMTATQTLLLCGLIVALASYSVSSADMCSSIHCLPGQKCVNNVGVRCVCRRNSDCPASFNPLCGSDGKSYDNYCIMKATACREDQQVIKMKEGNCLPSNACQIKPTSPCMAYFENFFYNVTTQRCEMFIAGGCHPSGWNGFHTMKECSDSCLVYKCKYQDAMPPANGIRIGDSFTVGSVLRFGCNKGYVINGQTELSCLPSGEWTSSPPVCKDACSTIQCPSGQKCVYEFTTGARCVCHISTDCPALLNPVCGSDGKSYINMCIMKATACGQGKVITKVKQGQCLPGNACQIKPTSPCRAYFENFFYNMTTQRCEMFIAGGCHPSGWNGFHTMKECSDSCSDKPCARCPLLKLSQACKDSSLVVVGKVHARLKETSNLTRYIMDIQSVLKVTTISLPEGKAVISIPYERSPDCACPRLPLNKKFILGSTKAQSTRNSSTKTGITLSGKVYLREWTSYVEQLLKSRCARYLDLGDLDESTQ